MYKTYRCVVLLLNRLIIKHFHTNAFFGEPLYLIINELCAFRKYILKTHGQIVYLHYVHNDPQWNIKT